MVSIDPRMDLTVSSRCITRILGTWIQEVISMPKATRQRLNPNEVRHLILPLLGRATQMSLSTPQAPGLLRLALEIARTLAIALRKLQCRPSVIQGIQSLDSSLERLADNLSRRQHQLEQLRLVL
jgi:hypothetical protein